MTHTAPPRTPQDSLPEHLRERICRTWGQAPAPRGEFVLYWTRSALRGRENPALDTAIEAARHLGLPVFVYQGLSERHPWANDRHHTFLLESARDMQRELAQRGLGFALHLERPGHRAPVLKLLAGRAALIITEEVPVQPLAAWTQTLARVAPLWTVDASCLVPMSMTREAPTRAFAFRQATQKLRQERLLRPWPEARHHGPAFVPEALPFAPLDLRQASDRDIAHLVAQCEIDHSVGPVPHTPGGSQAAYRRWDHFREQHLASYARHRNDALRPQAVSRMSAYLHHGCASALRLAREAAQVDNEGAQKYLDELLTWREVAWHFCYHTPANIDSLTALPDWAQQTLREHARDPRPASHDWETLARGRSGEELWDLAQQSLLIHGELHNNVRMTWGKVLTTWASPKGSLALLLDLNHRYALDGRDPASYGGLLWCLGLFDRPFPPAQPVTGTLRTRDPQEHARRLELSRWRRLIQRPAMDDAPEVAIIGAGLAGLFCARTLQDHGLRVTVFDKARGPSGRLSTRRHQEQPFDHGAQYFTARHPDFQRLVRAWHRQGVVQPWRGAQVRLSPAQPPEPLEEQDTRWVGAPRMSALGRHLARDLRELRCGVRVGALRRHQQQWILLDDQGQELGTWRRVVLATPAPQARALLEAPAPHLAQALEAVQMDPCWAMMLQLPQALDTGFDAARVRDSPLAWLARDSSKPGRPAGERWVAHASPAWSRQHLELPAEEIKPLLLGALAACLGRPLPPPELVMVHRWRYALASQPLGEPALYEDALGLGVCGDWCLGPRVEAAWRSGAAAAGRILGHFQRPLAQATPGRLL